MNLPAADRASAYKKTVKGARLEAVPKLQFWNSNL
jgi:hypothetical protein